MRRNVYLRLVSIFVVLNFILTDCAYAAGLDEKLSIDKLAAQSQAGLLRDLSLSGCLGELLQDADAVADIATLADALKPENAKRLSQQGIMMYISDDGMSRYFFNESGVFLRIRRRGEGAEDELSELLQAKGVPDIQGEYVFTWYSVNESNLEAVNCILRTINPGWRIKPASVTSIDPSRIKSQLFPQYLHAAIEAELRIKGFPLEKIERIMTRGAAYYDRETGNIVIEADVLTIIAKVISRTLKRNITAGDVGKVFILHETIERFISDRNIDFKPVLEKLVKYFKSKKQDPEEQLGFLFNDFCRNYKYNKSLPVDDLLREMVVHDFVERYLFKQPIRLINNKLERYDLPKDIERVLVSDFIGIFAEHLNLSGNETIDLYVDIMRLNEMDRVFLKGMYKKYKKFKYMSPEEKGKAELRIGTNFLPSAMLLQEERGNLLGAVDLDEVEDDADNEGSAKVVDLVLNPLDGGQGKAVGREDYLREMRPEFPYLTAKSADIFFKISITGYDSAGNRVDKEEKVSIMEAKLIKAAKERRKYKTVAYELLGSTETVEAINMLLDKTICLDDRIDDRIPAEQKRTYRRYLADNGVVIKGVVCNSTLPTYDEDGRCFTVEEMAPGNHGHVGIMLLMEAIKQEFPEGKSVIHTFYNGDGINNGVSPAMVGWMAKNKIPIVMLTTTRTPIDRKGGMIGVQCLGPNRTNPRPQIMELKQAQNTGQGTRFERVGLPGGEGEVDEQYFNTNTILLNFSILGPFLRKLREIIGDEEFIKIISPDLIGDRTKKKKFLIFGGAIGSLVLNLAAYVETTDNPSVIALLRESGIDKFLRIINIGKQKRSRYFTPFKYSSDFWFQFETERFEWDTGRWELEDRNQGKDMPEFNIPGEKEGQYYSDVIKIREAFRGVDITGLVSLEIEGKGVKMKGAVLNGKVFIKNNTGNEVDLNDPALRDQLLQQGVRYENGRLIIDNTTVIIGETSKSGPIGKRPTGKYAELWQMEVRDGNLGKGIEIGEGKKHEKFKKLEGGLGRLNNMLGRLTGDKEYGPGILAVVDRIRIVDNIDANKGLRLVPYAKMIKDKDGKNVLLLDVDALDNDELLYLVLDHDLKESITAIIPYENERIRELTTNFMSLRLGLDLIRQGKLDLSKLIPQLKRLDTDLQFFEALEVLQAMVVSGEEVTDEVIIAVAIEHMRAMPYYEGLFQGFSFEGEWRTKVEAEVMKGINRYKAAISVLNHIAEAKAVAATVTDTARRIDNTIDRLSVNIKKARMLSGIWRIDTGFLNTVLDKGKFVKLDIDELVKERNRYMLDWLKKLPERQQGAFAFYSSINPGSVKQFLTDNIPGGKDFSELTVGQKNIITLLDLEKITQPRDNSSLYLPYVYSITGIYLSAQVVIADGDINGIKDPLVRSTLEKSCEFIFGEVFDDDKFNKLFWGTWPKPILISESINAWRKAIIELEKAA